MTWAQRLVRRLPRSLAESIEAESRAWKLRCPNCEAERSWWDVGGVRFGASSKGKKVMLRCADCGRKGWHAVEKAPSE